MALPERTPHDATFKAVFSRPENALVLLRAALPPAVLESLDLTSLEPGPTDLIDDDLREQRTDLLFRARLRRGKREAFVYVLAEHQRKIDRFMVLRLLGYLVRIWEGWRRRHPDAKRLPVVIPLVLHQGPGPWTGPRSLAELYDAPPEVVALLGGLVPVLDVAFDDLGGGSPFDAAGPASGAPVLARLALALLRAMADPDLDPGDVLESLGALVRELARQSGGQADLRLLILYIALTRPGIDVPSLGERVRRVAGPEAGEVVMSTAQELIDQGVEQGEAQALRRVVVGLLSARFGELPSAVTERIAGASSRDLEMWTSRILDAKKIDDVFATPRARSSRAKRRPKGR